LGAEKTVGSIITAKPAATRTDEEEEFEERARAAAQAKFAEWHRLEKETRPRRIVYFCVATCLIAIVMILFVYAQSTARTH
jgi:hypothetical protein